MYIHQIKVTNYRSLKDVSIGDLSNFVVFYGDNDTGKSNVLSFLEYVFRQKYIVDSPDITQTEGIPRRPAGFWRGEIENFSDNFYLNGKEPITFSITIRFDRSEIEAVLGLPKGFLDSLRSNRVYDHLQIEGRIEPSIGDRAIMTLIEAQFDQKQFYDGKSSEPKYLPEFNLDSGTALDVFDKIMGKLNNAFLGVSADRFITTETELSRNNKAPLKPHSFKNWLFQSSLDRESERIFRQISDQFNAAPFSFGRISIARVSENEIEAFVEDERGFKLPIGRKGSGVQQVLMILSYVAASNAPFIGIEELEINLSPKAQTFLFSNLHKLVNTASSSVKQIFLTTHSPHLARRNEAERRRVWIEGGVTRIGKPSEAEVGGFFSFPVPVPLC